MVRDILEEKLDSLTSPSRSQLTGEESSKTLQSPLSKPTLKIVQMANREEVIDDNEEWVDRREPRVQPNTRLGRRELRIFNGREDPTRFLARYSLACRANNEGAPKYLLRIFSLALASNAADWFLDMDVP